MAKEDRHYTKVRVRRRRLPKKRLSGAARIFGALALAFGVLLITGAGVILASAFEAHVINVTAKIERPPGQCNALSIGYWRNHEGCAGGLGESNWTAEVNDLSATFAGVFGSYTGAQICDNLWVPNCPKGNSAESKLCKAKAQALADELNVVSDRLQLNALLAGADDGSAAFDNLGLSANSTVQDALTAVEDILADPSSTRAELTDAAYVAERIYAFYEDENPIRPQCIFSDGDISTSATEEVLISPLQDATDQDAADDESENTSISDIDAVPSLTETTTGAAEGPSVQAQNDGEDLVTIQGTSISGVVSPLSPEPPPESEEQSSSALPEVTEEQAPPEEEIPPVEEIVADI